MSSDYEVIVLFNGYSKEMEGGSQANCTCTLIKGPTNIIVDTMTAWDGEKIKSALNSNNVSCSDIKYVICSHGHSDHIGCNYLFQNAVHIVGFCISKHEIYTNHDFSSNEYIIDDNIKVISTPGHTLQDVTVLVNTEEGLVAITGDLFEREEDIDDPDIWKSAGSDSEKLQEENRSKILKIADFIIPGHGKKFKNRSKNHEAERSTTQPTDKLLSTKNKFLHSIEKKIEKLRTFCYNEEKCRAVLKPMTIYCTIL